MNAFNESGLENGVDKDALNDYNGNGFKSELEPFRNVKDSVFKRLFTDPKYLLQMYQTLHPEDKDTKAEDLNIVTLETVIIKDIQNNLGFTAGSELVVLAEAQSKWSVNIVVRGLLYLAQTYRNYLRMTKQNVYRSKPLDIPRAELYVIYTGTSKVTKEEITLSEEFFNGIPCSIETKVKVILENEGNDIINQYILFSKIMDEQIRIYGKDNKNKAVREALHICKDKNILKEFIESHEKEAIDIMVELYNQREAVEDYVEDYGRGQYAEGKAEGVTSATLDNIRNLMENLKMTVDQAMQALGIPADDQKKYQAML